MWESDKGKDPVAEVDEEQLFVQEVSLPRYAQVMFGLNPITFYIGSASFSRLSRSQQVMFRETVVPVDNSQN